VSESKFNGSLVLLFFFFLFFFFFFFWSLASLPPLALSLLPRRGRCLLSLCHTEAAARASHQPNESRPLSLNAQIDKTSIADNLFSTVSLLAPPRVDPLVSPHGKLDSKKALALI